MEFENCSCTGVNLDKLIQPTILLLLANKPLHGYALIARIADTPMFNGAKPDPTGVYRVLKSLEHRGLVHASWDVEGSGPARKIYAVTTDGYACLARWIVSLRKHLESVTAFLAMAREVGESAAARPCDCASHDREDPNLQSAGLSGV